MISFVFVLFSVCAFTQQEVTYPNLRSLRNGEFFIRFQVMDRSDSKKVKFDKDEVYYWFKSQKVMSTQGAASGVLLNGIYEEFYPTSQLKVRGAFKKGVKHSTWMYWDESGQLKREEHWRRGKRVKKAIEYDSSGEVSMKRNFFANRAVHYYDNKIVKTSNDSTEVEVIHKFDDGQTKEVERYKNGNLHGKQIKYSAAGNIVSLKRYKNGELHGKQVDEDGNTTYFKKGKEHTPFLKRLFGKKENSDSEKDEKEENDNSSSKTNEKDKDDEQQD